jgi:DinB superfamily
MANEALRVQDVLAEALENNVALVGRYLRDFAGATHTRQAPSLPNHVAWSLGHVAIVMSRVAERLDKKPLPPDAFTEAPRGDALRFGTEGVDFGSVVSDDPAAFPSFARSVDIFEAACRRLASAVRHATDAELATETPWGFGTSMPMHLLITRMLFHNGCHCGQIADLRRALAMPSVFP